MVRRTPTPEHDPDRKLQACEHAAEIERNSGPEWVIRYLEVQHIITTEEYTAWKRAQNHRNGPQGVTSLAERLQCEIAQLFDRTTQRQLNILVDKGITTVQHLAGRTDDELLTISYIGEGTLRFLNDALLNKLGIERDAEGNLTDALSPGNGNSQGAGSQHEEETEQRNDRQVEFDERE